MSWTNFTIFRAPSFCAKYLKAAPPSYRNVSNLIQESVILQVPSVVVFTGTKASVSLLLPQRLKMSGFLKKTLIGGFTCVNTCLAFDSQILLPKDNIDKHKLIFYSKINDVNKKKRITTKILKIDKNNQYRQAMTKPLCYSCIKKKKKKKRKLRLC